jgi:hypothetical protein
MLATSIDLINHQANIFKNLKMLVHIIQFVNIVGSHLHSLFFFIIDTNYSFAICSRFFEQYDISTVRGKAMPLQALTGPEDSRRVTRPDLKTIGT